MPQQHLSLSNVKLYIRLNTQGKKTSMGRLASGVLRRGHKRDGCVQRRFWCLCDEGGGRRV